MTAKMLLVKKIGNNTPECISEGKDVYKRTLAECFINGESLSSFLVRSGYAFAYRKYSKKFIKDEMAKSSKSEGTEKIVDAASAVVASMNQKLQTTLTELNAVKKALEDERGRRKNST